MTMKAGSRSLNGELFRRLGGTCTPTARDWPPHWLRSDAPYIFPCIHSEPRHTPAGTPYLVAPGVAVIARPEVLVGGLAPFLAGFGTECGFADYVEDSGLVTPDGQLVKYPTYLAPGAHLVKVAGQTCYASFGPKRTRNANAQRYLDNLVASGHGSVFEHANYTLLFYGISRSVSHEWVRHRAGWAYS